MIVWLFRAHDTFRAITLDITIVFDYLEHMTYLEPQHNDIWLFTAYDIFRATKLDKMVVFYLQNIISDF